MRFNTTLSDRTLVKIMTDGILLAEIAHDRLLRRYDTIIIDEAHERSLNIDLLLGYLAQLLPRRPDLKVIVTSATIDTERFAAHFAGCLGPGQTVPIIEVSGRMYPVELRYRPLDRGEGPARRELDQPQAIVEAVRELSAEGPGDILVFCSGEREIRDAADALGRSKGSARLADEVIPLYARLSIAEQHRVFAPHPGRRVVLATNVAETSLTVPGIRYVVDTGNARISRYSFRTKVQRLPIERVSQASALQRTGRCGRLANGICIRLYSQEDHDSRPPFTDPEITRTNLASVLLQMAALGLGDPGEVDDFPFVDAPDRRGIRDGLALLRELGALTAPQTGGHAKLTPIGRQLTQLPIDPRLGRMVLEAGRLGCLPEVIVVAAALSIQDPRERPADSQQAADASHARFADPTSDFLGMLNLWRHLAEEQRSRSSSSFRRMCTAEFLHYLRIREWQDLVSQLRTAAEGLDLAGAGSAARAVAGRGCAPSGPARRAALARRHARGRSARIPRRSRHEVRHLPGLGVGEEAAPLGDGRRTRRDLAAVGSRRRPYRTGVGAAAGRAPHHADVQRAALGEAPGPGDGVRTRHALRPADRQRPQGRLRPDRPGALA